MGAASRAGRRPRHARAAREHRGGAAAHQRHELRCLRRALLQRDDRPRQRLQRLQREQRLQRDQRDQRLQRHRAALQPLQRLQPEQPHQRHLLLRLARQRDLRHGQRHRAARGRQAGQHTRVAALPPYCDPCLAPRRIVPRVFNHSSISADNSTLLISIPHEAELLRTHAHHHPLASLVTMVHVPAACGPFYLHPRTPCPRKHPEGAPLHHGPGRQPDLAVEVSVPERIEVHPALEVARWHPELYPLAPPTLEAAMTTHHVAVAVPVGETFDHNDEESLRSAVKPSGDGEVSVLRRRRARGRDVGGRDRLAAGEPGGHGAARGLLVGAGWRQRLELQGARSCTPPSAAAAAERPHRAHLPRRLPRLRHPRDRVDLRPSRRRRPRSRSSRCLPSARSPRALAASRSPPPRGESCSRARATACARSTSARSPSARCGSSSSKTWVRGPSPCPRAARRAGAARRVAAARRLGHECGRAHGRDLRDGQHARSHRHLT